MRNICIIFSLLLFASCARVTGVVTTNGGVPIRGAIVSLDAADKAVSTSKSGRYTITTWSRVKASTIRAWLPVESQDSATIKIIVMRGKARNRAQVNLVISN